MRESRRARTAVVNGNNCCGRCHSKARVPNARCQTVVRVITVITSYRGMCAGPMQPPRSLALASAATHRDRPIRNRFSTLARAVAVESVATIGRKRTRTILENAKDGRKVPKWSTHTSLAFFSGPSVFPSALLETNARRETDKRRRGLMILRRRLGRRIMRDLREDELEPVFLTCGPHA